MIRFISLLLLFCFQLSVYAQNAESLDFSVVKEKIAQVNSYVANSGDEKNRMIEFQVRFSNFMTRFAAEDIGNNELQKIRRDLTAIDKEIEEIQGTLQLNLESLGELESALRVNLDSFAQLKKSVGRSKTRAIQTKKKKIKSYLKRISTTKKTATKYLNVVKSFLNNTQEWKKYLSTQAQKGLSKKIKRWEVAELISNPGMIGEIIKKDYSQIAEDNRTERYATFLKTNSVKVFLRLFLSVVLFVFFIKVSKVVEMKVSIDNLREEKSHLLNDVVNLFFSHKVLFSFSAFYLLTHQELGVLAYKQLPSGLNFIFVCFLALFFWHYFYTLIVIPRVNEVNREYETNFVFRKYPLIFYIIFKVFSSSFGIENVLLDSISNFLLLFISYKFFWLSYKFKVRSVEGEERFYALFTRSSKFLVMFFSSILFVSCLLNFFGSFTLGNAIQSVVFSNLVIFIVVWFLYQIFMINLDNFITKVDQGNLRFRKRVVDILVFIRNYSNILLLAGFSYFVLDSWFQKLFVFKEFSKISLLQMGEYSLSVVQPFYIVWFVFCIRLSHLVLLWAVDSYLLRKFKISRRHSANIYSITRYIYFVIYFLVISALLGVTYKNLLIFASALGVGIGFGLQNIVNNFLSGIILLFEQPIRVGDLIDIEGDLCQVKHLGIRSTIVQTLDNSSVIIPNSELLSNRVTNWTLNDTEVAIKCQVGVAYGTDTKLMTTLLHEVATKNRHVLSFPEPQVWFDEFGDSSLNFTLKVWIDRPMQKFVIKSDLMHAMNEKIGEHKITIPFPQRDVHLIV